MTEELPKQELLIKIMGMTSSSNDGECLTAIRMANELLSANKWSWEKLIHSKIKIIEDPFKNVDARVAPRAAPASMSTPDRPNVRAPSPPPPSPKPQPVPRRPDQMPELNANEKDLIRKGKKYGAAADYRNRIGCTLFEAENKMEDWACFSQPIFKSPKRAPLDRQTTADLLNQSMPPVSPSPKTEFFSAKPKRPSTGGPGIGEL